jgi:hypothetical protein
MRRCGRSFRYGGVLEGREASILIEVLIVERMTAWENGFQPLLRVSALLFMLDQEGSHAVLG